MTDKMQETKTVEEIQKLIPEIDLLRFFKGISPAGFSMPTQIRLYHLDYYQNLSNIIRSTPRETLRAHFHWGLISKWADRLSDAYFAAIQRFQNLLRKHNLNETVPRKEACTIEVNYFLPYLWDGIFIQRAFTMKAQQLGEKIVTDLKSAIIEDVKTRAWMTEKSKTSVSTKGSAAQLYVSTNGA